MIVNGTSQFIFIASNNIIDLNMISDDDKEYFMILYGDYSNEWLVCGVFYLEYDSSSDEYNIENSGNFDTLYQPYNYDDIIAYIVSETSNLFFVWDTDEDFLFGQAFTIN